MGRTIGSLGAVVGLSLLFAACSGSSKTSGKDPEPNVCLAGSRTCAGLIVKVCNDDGTALITEKTCVAPQTCADGACAETSCVPNTKHCKDGSVWKCDSTGGGSTLSQTCAKSQFCREADDSATCSDQACTAGEKLCDGEVATTCRADGSGPKESGVDCAETKQTCYQGACQDNECTPGTKVCQSGDVYLCAKNGTDTSLLADCQAGTVCDGNKTACTAKVCDVGAAGCDGMRAVKCNAFGSGWEPGGTDCAADGSVCVAGACKKKTCTPSGTFCQGNDIYQCDHLGVASSLSQTCKPPYYHCQASPSSNYAYCANNDCFPGEVAKCFGNEVRACNEDGSAAATGTDCGDDKYCEEGTCKTRICEPGTVYCKNGDVYNCEWPGAYEYVSLDCPTDTACDAEAYACVPMPCSPGTTTCLANKVGTCAADGQSLTSTTVDCTASSSICDSGNQCVKSAVDTLGSDDDPNIQYPSYVFGNIVKVSSTRKLSDFQMTLDLGSTPRELRWVVFEETAANTYTAKTETKVSSQTGKASFNSGPISNYTLKAGTTYFFGVRVLGGNTSVAYLDVVPFVSSASFGTVLGQYQGDYASPMYASPDTQAIYQMKVTTAP
jgi:hypothetical protein